MVARALENFDVKPFSPSLQVGAYAATVIAAPICDSPTVGDEVQSLPAVVEGRKGLLQGIKFALGLQAAVAFCFFAVWLAWRMLR